MIKSMTGYGRNREIAGGYDILCEVKTVNSKFLDTNIKLPRVYAAIEDNIRQLASKYFARGKAEIYIAIEKVGGDDMGLSVNEAYLDSYIELLKNIKEKYSLSGDITIQTIASKNEVFLQTKPDEDMKAVSDAVLSVAGKAFEACVEMRKIEGEKLSHDLLSHLSEFEEIQKTIAERAPVSVKENNEKMKERIQELLGDVDYDEARLLTECAVFADKADINEELKRLVSHFQQFRQIINEDVPVGRKLDFLVQEMNRETNTIGSKASDTAIAKLVIEGKCIVERIREQIQNIE